jgi:hypothetical protein
VQRQRNELRQHLREQKAVKEDSAMRLAELQAQKETMLAEAQAAAQEEVVKEREVRRGAGSLWLFGFFLGGGGGGGVEGAGLHGRLVVMEARGLAGV